LHALVWPRAAEISAALPAKLIAPDASVFESGVGYGRDAIFFAKSVNAVHDIDPSEEGTSYHSLLSLSKSPMLPQPHE
jgi:hypothetical protein